MISTLLFLVAFFSSVALAIATDDNTVMIGAVSLAIMSLGLTFLSYVTTYKE